MTQTIFQKLVQYFLQLPSLCYSNHTMLPIFLLIKINIWSRTSNFCLRPLFFHGEFAWAEEKYRKWPIFYTGKDNFIYIIIYRKWHAKFALWTLLDPSPTSSSKLRQLQWLPPFPLSHSFYFWRSRYMLVDPNHTTAKNPSILIFITFMVQYQD